MSRQRWFRIVCDKCGYVSLGGDPTVGAVLHAECPRSAEEDKPPFFGDGTSKRIELCGACFAEYMAEWVHLGKASGEAWAKESRLLRARQNKSVTSPAKPGEEG